MFGEGIPKDFKVIVPQSALRDSERLRKIFEQNEPKEQNTLLFGTRVELGALETEMVGYVPRGYGVNVTGWKTKKLNPLGISTSQMMWGEKVPLTYAKKQREAFLVSRSKHTPKWTTLPSGQVVNEAYPMLWLRDEFWIGWSTFLKDKYLNFLSNLESGKVLLPKPTT